MTLTALLPVERRLQGTLRNARCSVGADRLRSSRATRRPMPGMNIHRLIKSCKAADGRGPRELSMMTTHAANGLNYVFRFGGK
jgi:hypothetical protein